MNWLTDASRNSESFEPGLSSRHQTDGTDGTHGISHPKLRDPDGIGDGISLGIWHGTSRLSPLNQGTDLNRPGIMAHRN
jgi:hypothetical protein